MGKNINFLLIQTEVIIGKIFKQNQARSFNITKFENVLTVKTCDVD
jgi:hypothetical protein